MRRRWAVTVLALALLALVLARTFSGPARDRPSANPPGEVGALADDSAAARLVIRNRPAVTGRVSGLA